MNCRRLSCGSIPSYLTSGSTQPEWEEEGQPNCGPLCTFAEADPLYRAFLKREGNNSPKEAGSRNEGGGKLPLLECKQLLDFFLERTAIEIIKKG